MAEEADSIAVVGSTEEGGSTEQAGSTEEAEENSTAEARSTDFPAVIPGLSAVLIMEARPEASPPAGSRASAVASMVVAEAFMVVAAVMGAAVTDDSGSA
jgi:hypothetical protein